MANSSNISIIISAILGLIAGIGHGVISHHADLPLALPDQVLQAWQADQRQP